MEQPQMNFQKLIKQRGLFSRTIRVSWRSGRKSDLQQTICNARNSSGRGRSARLAHVIRARANRRAAGVDRGTLRSSASRPDDARRASRARRGGRRAVGCSRTIQCGGKLSDEVAKQLSKSPARPWCGSNPIGSPRPRQYLRPSLSHERHDLKPAPKDRHCRRPPIRRQHDDGGGRV